MALGARALPERGTPGRRGRRSPDRRRSARVPLGEAGVPALHGQLRMRWRSATPGEGGRPDRRLDPHGGAARARRAALAAMTDACCPPPSGAGRRRRADARPHDPLPRAAPAAGDGAEDHVLVRFSPLAAAACWRRTASCGARTARCSSSRASSRSPGARRDASATSASARTSATAAPTCRPPSTPCAARRAVLASSSVYETEPVGEVLDQREFFNACLRIETDLSPEALLDACKAVERAPAARPAACATARGRSTSTCCCSATSRPLGAPDAAAREVTTRRFVLVPLLELAPELDVPGRGRAADALAALGPGRTCGWRGRRSRSDAGASPPALRPQAPRSVQPRGRGAPPPAARRGSPGTGAWPARRPAGVDPAAMSSMVSISRRPAPTCRSAAVAASPPSCPRPSTPPRDEVGAEVGEVGAHVAGARMVEAAGDPGDHEREARRRAAPGREAGPGGEGGHRRGARSERGPREAAHERLEHLVAPASSARSTSRAARRPPGATAAAPGERLQLPDDRARATACAPSSNTSPGTVPRPKPRRSATRLTSGSRSIRS